MRDSTCSRVNKTSDISPCCKYDGMDVMSEERIGAVNEKRAFRFKRRRAAAAPLQQSISAMLGDCTGWVGLGNKITVLKNALHEGGGRQSVELHDHASTQSRESSETSCCFLNFFHIFPKGCDHCDATAVRT